MKIIVNHNKGGGNKEILELTDIQKQVIQNDIEEDIFDADMERRLAWILTHKYEQCFDRLKKEWEPKLEEAGEESLPTNKDTFAALVFARPEYKNKSAKIAAEKAKDIK